MNEYNSLSRCILLERIKEPLKEITSRSFYHYMLQPLLKLTLVATTSYCLSFVAGVVVVVVFVVSTFAS